MPLSSLSSSKIAIASAMVTAASSRQLSWSPVRSRTSSRTSAACARTRRGALRVRQPDRLLEHGLGLLEPADLEQRLAVVRKELQLRPPARPRASSRRGRAGSPPRARRRARRPGDPQRPAGARRPAPSERAVHVERARARRDSGAPARGGSRGSPRTRSAPSRLTPSAQLDELLVAASRRARLRMPS